MMNKISEMNDVRDEIELLECEREACDFEQKKRIDRRIADLKSILDCLIEACS